MLTSWLECPQNAINHLNNIHEKITQFRLAEKRVQFLCNASARLVTRVQITNGFSLAENTKETTKNQSDYSCFNNKIQENGHGFQQRTMGFNFVRKTTIENLKNIPKTRTQ